MAGRCKDFTRPPAGRSLRGHRGWQMANHDLRAALGLRALAKLPESLPAVKVGDTWVWVETPWQARERAGYEPGRFTHSRLHRVWCRCPCCGTEVPAGRLHQHQTGASCRAHWDAYVATWTDEERGS